MSGFRVLTTSRFDREFRKLAAQHPRLREGFREIVEALAEDPYNRSGRFPIKKLHGVVAGEGEYRIRAGRFRFRYDVEGRRVYLKACSPRREDTY